MAGNLIDNACKWAHRNIRVEAAPLNGAKFSLRVSDDGPGLEPEERARAMQRGERFDETVPGTGLGLAIVRDIAKLYGGNIALANPRWAASKSASNSRARGKFEASSFL